MSKGIWQNKTVNNVCFDVIDALYPKVMRVKHIYEEMLRGGLVANLTPKQVHNAVGNLVLSGRIVLADNMRPYRYRSVRKHVPEPFVSQGTLRKYIPPMRPLQGYGDYLFSHYEQCKSARDNERKPWRVA